MSNNQRIIPLCDTIDLEPGVQRLSSRRSAIRPPSKIVPDYINNKNMCNLCFETDILQQCKECSTFVCGECLDKNKLCNKCKKVHRPKRTIFHWFCCN